MVEEKKRGGYLTFFHFFSDRHQIDPVNKSIPILKNSSPRHGVSDTPPPPIR